MSTADLGNANAGQITCGTVDGVDLAALDTDVNDHDHALSGNVGMKNATLTVYDSALGSSFHTAADGAGSGATYESASVVSNHDHGVGTLATDATQAPTALTPANNDQIILGHVVGDITCDLIDGIAPEVLYDEYDDHTHTVAGQTANETIPALYPHGASNTYFRVATNASGDNPEWDTVRCNAGAHLHTQNSIALLAHAAQTKGGTNEAGNPKIAIASATGNISLKGDVNDVGINEFKTDYDGHDHNPTGTTANHTQSDAAVFSVSSSKTYFEVSAGVWKTAFVRRPAHNHAGSTLGVATPT